MRTIAIANQKGGCGKTTTAINLSSALALTGKTVLLIDLDPQAHASFGLGAVNQSIDKSVYCAMTDNQEKRRALKDCIVKLSERLDIVPSNILLSTLEQELKDKEDAVSKLYQAVIETKLAYDYIVIDCPPSLGFLTFNALRACEQVLVPIDMSAFSLMGVGKLLGMLELIKIKINHAPIVNAVATLYDRRTKYSETMLNEIKSFFKEQLMKTVIRLNVALKKAAAKGISVMAFDKESNGAKDYTELAEELLKTDGANEFEKALGEVIETPEKEEIREKALITVAQEAFSHVEEAPPSIENVLQPEKTDVPTVAEEPSRREIAFRLNLPSAREIYLVGDFNGWQINDDARLNRREDGSWEKTLGLAGGRHRYKYIVDGQWIADPINEDREQNIFGTFDSVINVKHPD